MESKIKRKYLIEVGIQILVILVFAVINYFIFKIEKVILNPIPYVVCLALLLIILDVVLLLFINKRDNIENSKESEIVE